MARIESYRDLTAWQKAMALAAECYRFTRALPVEERYGLTAQTRKAAVSIPSNLAEGHNRRSRQAFANHVSIALGSQAEVETQIRLCVIPQFAPESAATPVLQLAAAVGRLLHGLVRSLESTD
ncbi:MAG TPA: four helix bundle protein [Vicinamibacterales bacterium]|nr:four helix bundle protein [Vicinamibacterales bacterium]HPW20478.1 four helix bundle protein [Vicinamibacterales bacterium]